MILRSHVKPRGFWRAIALLSGTIIGVGMFGLPYVATKSGLLVMLLYVVALTGVVTIVHLAYGEVIGRTEGTHRLIGYAERYLGKWGKFAEELSTVIGIFSSLLAYIILGGEFLYILLGGVFGGNAQTWGLILWVISAAVIFIGVRYVAKGELVLGALLVGGIALLALWLLAHHVAPGHITWIGTNNWFLPYGVILFAIGGASVIPEMTIMLIERPRRLRRAILAGTLLPVVLYVLFTVAIVRTTGSATTPEAIEGLRTFLGDNVVVFGAVIGFLSVITSIFTLGLVLKESFQFDIGLPHVASWLLVVVVPLVLFFATSRDFIRVISFAGAVLGGIDGAIILLAHRRAKKLGTQKPAYNLRIPTAVLAILLCVFALGIVYQFIYPS